MTAPLMSPMAPLRRLAAAVLCWALCACVRGDIPRDPPDTEPPPPLPPATELDVLFVVENAGLLRPEQLALSAQMPRLFEALSGHFESIHVGVITTDMGTGGFTVPGCPEPNFGDDGILTTPSPDCVAAVPPFSSGASPEQLAEETACLLQVGEMGCRIEQPLEALLKAVTSEYESATGAFDGFFLMATPGHGDGANAAFFRADAHLAIVVLAEEDDCSMFDLHLAEPESERYPGDLNLRCFRYPDALRPADRYVDGLLASRHVERVSFHVVAGVPVDLVDSSLLDILSDPRMEEVVDPTMPTQLLPSCNVAGLGLSFPPRRLVDVALRLSERGVPVSVSSICQSDLSSAVDRIARVLTD